MTVITQSTQPDASAAPRTTAARDSLILGGRAIRESLRALGSDAQSSRAVILITDGEDHDGRPRRRQGAAVVARWLEPERVVQQQREPLALHALANDDPEWITITLRAIGEMTGAVNGALTRFVNPFKRMFSHV